MLEQQAHPAPAVVTVPAEVDLTNQERVCDQLHAAFACGARVVVADFTATTFCDCSSLRLLLAVQRRAAASGGQLRLAIPAGSPVRRLAELTGLDRSLTVSPSLREAAGLPPGPPPGRPGRVTGADRHGGRHRRRRFPPLMVLGAHSLPRRATVRSVKIS
jgi:anti-sigma B factor antagonist